MHISPKDSERLQIFTLAELARRRRSREQPLGAVEAVALVCDEIAEAAWAGCSLDELVEVGRHAVAGEHLLDGVASLVPMIQYEALTPAGSVLVTVPEPFGGADPEGPGGIRTGAGDVVLSPTRSIREVTIRNASTQTIRVSSHFPLAEVNRALEFDRSGLQGSRLAIPSGASVAFEPGVTLRVRVLLAGGEG